MHMEKENTVKNLLNCSSDFVQAQILESLIENLPIPISVVSTEGIVTAERTVFSRCIKLESSSLGQP